MVRAVLCAPLLFVASEGTCNCDTTPAFAAPRPILRPPVKASATPTPQTSIGKVADEDEDWSKTMEKILNGAAQMAGQIVAGNPPSEADILKSVGALVIEGIGMENPILGSLASFIYSFFEGLFGDKSNQYRELYDMIMNQVKEMIHESEIQSEMKNVKNLILGYIDKSDYLSRTGQEQNAQFFYDNRYTVLDSNCLAKDWSASSCRDWEQHGAVVHSVLFATLHLQTLNEIAADYLDRGQKSKANQFLQEIVDRGNEYKTILRHSLNTWHNHRMQQQNLNFYNAAVGGNCFINHQGDCYAKSADHYGSTIEGCPACDFCITEMYEDPYKTRTIAWHNAWSNCHTDHRSSLQKTMNQVSKAIDGIAKLTAAASGASAPAPAPLPVFKDRLLVGQSLTLDNVIVSSNGWNTLILQSDYNLVLYANNFDGYNSDLSKPTWSTGKAGSHAKLNFQTDGNVVLTSDSGVKWSTNSAGKGGQRFVMQNDGNLCLYTSGGSAIWCSNSHTYGSGLDNASAIMI
jgi:hypothetical protein